MNEHKLFMIIGSAFPIGMMAAVLFFGMSYADDVSNGIKADIPGALSCEEIEWKINYFDENRVLGIDTDGIIKEYKIKAAKMGCGF